MQGLNFGLPGAYLDFEACREMATDASVERTYFVSSPLSASSDAVHVTRSLSTAFELWKSTPRRRLSIAFNWAIGDESGAGAIRYGGQEISADLTALTETVVQDLIVRDITRQLFLRIPQLEIA